MRIGENKLIKINGFDLLDAGKLEQYLSKMAMEGWMISKVSRMFLTFEKTDPKVVNFFVDITDKDLLGDNYTATKDYIEAAKKEGLEHICGNEKFQIFINRGSKKSIDKSKLKFSKVFSEEFGIIINMFFVLLPFLLGRSFMGDSFIHFISNNFLMIWIGTAAIVILYNLLLIVFKFIRYKKIMGEDNHSLEEVRYRKHNFLLNKYSLLASTLFIIFTFIGLFSVASDGPTTASKNMLPLALEDFDVDIQDSRETSRQISSSYFAKYADYYDYTYKEVSNAVYDEEIGSEYEEVTDENATMLSYSIFESKYEQIINKAKNSILNQYNEYEVNYKKVSTKEELKNWGAKEVYTGDFLYKRVVIYDDRIITINGDIDYNKENINIIKSKIIN